MTDTASPPGTAFGAAMRWSSVCSWRRLALGTCWAGTWRPAGAVPHARGAGPSTSAELAQAGGLNGRLYVREWLEQQASSAILDLEEAGTDPAVRRFSLPAGHDEALVDDASLNCIAPLGQLVVACGRPIDAVLDAFRSGGGVPYAGYDADCARGRRVQRADV